jgi:hypothetical protein
MNRKSRKKVQHKLGKKTRKNNNNKNALKLKKLTTVDKLAGREMLKLQAAHVRAARAAPYPYSKKVEKRLNKMAAKGFIAERKAFAARKALNNYIKKNINHL